MKIAAIDLGSNAVRLAIAKCKNEEGLDIIYKERKALRLGTEAFGLKQTFSENTFKKSLKTFEHFAEIMKEENVKHYKAFATSAFRDAQNSNDLAQTIKKETGIKIERMPGNLEAEVILNSILQKMEIDEDKNYLLFDLGGGSLELSKIEKGEIIGSKSFDIGTVRLMNQPDFSKKENTFKLFLKHQEEIQNFLEKKDFNKKRLRVIGTGGNFRRCLKIVNHEYEGKKKYFRPHEFLEIKKDLEKRNYQERIKDFDLREDRADVIIPAVKIINFILKDLEVSKVYAPNIGLLEGILENLSEQWC
jgi:exopolyphosphatase/guanosine-5'-triphosphate,3'-diphosphate pyrophosphatase